MASVIHSMFSCVKYLKYLKYCNDRFSVIVQTKALVDEKLPSYLKEAAKGWKQKTSIKKKDLNPTWNETKTFHSVYCLDKGEGIKVLFKVFDWDMLSRDVSIDWSKMMMLINNGFE